MNCCDFKKGDMRPIGSLMITSTQMKAEDPLTEELVLCCGVQSSVVSSKVFSNSCR